MQVACLNLTRALAGRGHDVWVFAQGPRDARDEGGWHLRQVPPTVRVGQTPVSRRLFTEPGDHLDGADVVLAYMGDQPAPLAARRWARRWKAPLVVSYHGDPVGGFGGRLRRAAVWLHERVLGPRVLRDASAIVALSEASASSSRLLAAHRRKTRVLPNGVDPEPAWRGSRAAARASLGLSDRDLAILFVGSLSPIKGLDVLLDALPRLEVPHGKGAVLLVAGDGPSRADLERQARARAAAVRVRFLGFVPAGQAGLFAASDVLVLPSRSEAFPLTLLEAGIARLPAVATRLPALEALVQDGVSGLLVPVDDAAALARALGALLADEASRRRMGEAAHAWASRFTWPGVARQTEAFLQEVRGASAAPAVTPGRGAAAPGPASRRPRR